MKRLAYIILSVALVAVCLSCSSDDDNGGNGGGGETKTYDKTILMYLPWSGNLTSAFWGNVADMKKAYDNWATKGEHIVVFICTSESKAVMFNISDYTGNDSLSLAQYKQYVAPSYTTVDGIAQIITDMKTMAPAPTYAMTVGCHGLGWVFKDVWAQSRSGARRVKSGERQYKAHWEYVGNDGVTTRYFGGTSVDYQVDISTFAEALSASDTKLQFLLFDDCYMSSIEAAYDLRHVTDFLIACPTEIMGYGMPYSTMGRYLFGTPDYEKVCEAFYDFYSTYKIGGSLYNYGTIGVTKMSELDSLASIAKEINEICSFDANELGDLQRMDGYTPILFYDYGDYVAHLCTDTALLQKFNAQLDKAVPYRAHTEKYYSAFNGSNVINTYSGITTSEPSTHPCAAYVVDTGWYKATH